MSIENNTSGLQEILEQARNLPNAGGGSVEIVQTIGDSKTAVMSQKAVSEAIEAVIEVSDTEPTDPNTEIWINLSEEGGGSVPGGSSCGCLTDPDCHAEYFRITEDGVVSLKPEYRGATTKAAYANSVSDMGAGVAGSKNAQLPNHLVIPEIVEGVVVNELADAMFYDNNAFEYVTLPNTITEIPFGCFFNSHWLKEVYNTGNITVLGEKALCRASSLVRASFPNLESMALQSLQACPSLVYADVGNVTEIPEFALGYNLNIQRLKSAGKITTIGPTAFPKCAKLKHFEGLKNVTNVGDTGLWGSGVPYTEQQKLTGKTLGTFAIAPQVNPTDFWSGCTYTPCENPLPTYLAQNNQAWADRTVGLKTYKTACMLFDVVHAYCGLYNVKLNNVDEMEAFLNGIDPTILAEYDSEYTHQAIVAQKMGLKVDSYKTVNQTVLQTVYTALAAGKYVSVTSSNWNNGAIKGHVALLYGVTEKGEFMVCDTQNTWYQDMSKPCVFTIPFQNFFANEIANRNSVLEIYSKP